MKVYIQTSTLLSPSRVEAEARCIESLQRQIEEGASVMFLTEPGQEEDAESWETVSLEPREHTVVVENVKFRTFSQGRPRLTAVYHFEA